MQINGLIEFQYFQKYLMTNFIVFTNKDRHLKEEK